MISQENINGKRIFLFIIITFAFSYTMWGLVALNIGGLFSLDSLQGMALYMLGGLSPAIVMFVLVKKWGESREEKAYFRLIFRTKYGWKLTVFVTALFLVIYLSIAMTASERIEPLYMLAVYFPIMIIGGGVEEIGWRGFFQSALEQKLPFLLATLIVGVIWAAWHIPLWFIQGTGQSHMSFLLFSIYCILMSYILAVLQRLTGSVVASISFHAWANVMFSVFNILPIFGGEDIYLFMGLMLGFAIIAIVAASIQKKRINK